MSSVDINDDIPLSSNLNTRMNQKSHSFSNKTPQQIRNNINNNNSNNNLALRQVTAGDKVYKKEDIFIVEDFDDDADLLALNEDDFMLDFQEQVNPNIQKQDNHNVQERSNHNIQKRDNPVNVILDDNETKRKQHYPLSETLSSSTTSISRLTHHNIQKQDNHNVQKQPNYNIQKRDSSSIVKIEDHGTKRKLHPVSEASSSSTTSISRHTFTIKNEDDDIAIETFDKQDTKQISGINSENPLIYSWLEIENDLRRNKIMFPFTFHVKVIISLAKK